MKKASLILTAAIITIGMLCGCSKTQEKAEEKEFPKALKPVTTKIEGNLGNHFELIDKEYKFPTVSNNVQVELKRISSEYEYGSTKAGVGIEIYDKDGNVLASQAAILEPITPMEWGSVFPTQEGEICRKTIYLPDWPDAYYGAETFKLTMIANESPD